jgi:hypothetical protein
MVHGEFEAKAKAEAVLASHCNCEPMRPSIDSKLKLGEAQKTNSSPRKMPLRGKLALILGAV